MLAHLLRKYAKKSSPDLLRRLANLWLPFWGAGININYISADYREIKVQMKLRWYNRNYVGTHFGGSIYAMTDAFYMMMLINNLGRDYIVWDKGAQIKFIKPGRGTLYVHFVLSEQEISAIKQNADSAAKYVFDLPVQVKDDAGEVVASVMKTLYVRCKKSEIV
ncbi:MAG: DUF4442 domain-containing protein [Gammaproteobacteria bacterium]